MSDFASLFNLSCLGTSASSSPAMVIPPLVGRAALSPAGAVPSLVTRKPWLPAGAMPSLVALGPGAEEEELETGGIAPPLGPNNDIGPTVGMGTEASPACPTIMAGAQDSAVDFRYGT